LLERIFDGVSGLPQRRFDVGYFGQLVDRAGDLLRRASDGRGDLRHLPARFGGEVLSNRTGAALRSGPGGHCVALTALSGQVAQPKLAGDLAKLAGDLAKLPRDLIQLILNLIQLSLNLAKLTLYLAQASLDLSK
jgi:hypothetical protein